jgi:hypothetical protein
LLATFPVHYAVWRRGEAVFFVAPSLLFAPRVLLFEPTTWRQTAPGNGTVAQASTCGIICEFEATSTPRAPSLVDTISAHERLFRRAADGHIITGNKLQHSTRRSTGIYRRVASNTDPGSHIFSNTGLSSSKILSQSHLFMFSFTLVPFLERRVQFEMGAWRLKHTSAWK